MKKKVIWIVDDDLIYQTIIKKIIEKTTFFSTYSSFTNGKLALICLKETLDENNEKLPDIILLDINMPVMDGWEFMDEFKKINPIINKKIDIYIVSSSIAIEDKEKTETYTEIIGYIKKPISVDNLSDLFQKN